MSLWACPDHGLTGPRACCAKASRVFNVVEPPTDGATTAGRTDEAADRRATNYHLAYELLCVGEWVIGHALPGEKCDAKLAIIGRAVEALRGAREPITEIEKLLRVDPWAAAIARHVSAQLRQQLAEREQENARLSAALAEAQRQIWAWCAYADHAVGCLRCGDLLTCEDGARLRRETIAWPSSTGGS